MKKIFVLTLVLTFFVLKLSQVYAQEYNFKIPVQITTDASKTEYAYRIQELLRKLHNFVGRWYREGITLDEYNNLPKYIKDRVSYTPQLTETQWNNFLENIYDPRERAVIRVILASRENFKNSNSVSAVDLGGDFEAIN